MQKTFIRLQLRIVLADRKKTTASSQQTALLHRLSEVIVGSDLFVRSAGRILNGREQLSPRFSDSGKHTLFQAGYTLYRGDDIRNQVGAPLHLVLNLCPLGVYVLLLRNQRVVTGDSDQANQ